MVNILSSYRYGIVSVIGIPIENDCLFTDMVCEPYVNDKRKIFYVNDMGFSIKVLMIYRATHPWYISHSLTSCQLLAHTAEENNDILGCPFHPAIYTLNTS